MENQQPQREMIQIEKEYFNVLKHRIADLYMRLDEQEMQIRGYLERIRSLENAGNTDSK